MLRRAPQLSTSHTASINCRCRARVGGREQLERSIKLLAWTYSSSHLMPSTMLQELSTFIGLAGLLLKMAAGFSSITSSGRRTRSTTLSSQLFCYGGEGASRSSSFLRGKTFGQANTHLPPPPPPPSICLLQTLTLSFSNIL